MDWYANTYFERLPSEIRRLTLRHVYGPIVIVLREVEWDDEAEKTFLYIDVDFVLARGSAVGKSLVYSVDEYRDIIAALRSNPNSDVVNDAFGLWFWLSREETDTIADKLEQAVEYAMVTGPSDVEVKF